jgi:hypothetical protein
MRSRFPRRFDGHRDTCLRTRLGSRDRSAGRRFVGSCRAVLDLLCEGRQFKPHISSPVRQPWPLMYGEAVQGCDRRRDLSSWAVPRSSNLLRCVRRIRLQESLDIRARSTPVIH